MNEILICMKHNNSFLFLHNFFFSFQAILSLHFPWFIYECVCTSILFHCYCLRHKNRTIHKNAFSVCLCVFFSHPHSHSSIYENKSVGVFFLLFFLIRSFTWSSPHNHSHIYLACCFINSLFECFSFLMRCHLNYYLFDFAFHLLGVECAACSVCVCVCCA